MVQAHGNRPTGCQSRWTTSDRGQVNLCHKQVVAERPGERHGLPSREMMADDPSDRRPPITPATSARTALIAIVALREL